MPLDNMHVHTVTLPGGGLRVKVTHLTTGETVISEGVSRREAKAKAYAVVAERVGMTLEEVQAYADKVAAEKERIERKQSGDLVFEAFDQSAEDVFVRPEKPGDPESPLVEVTDGDK